MKKSKFGFTLLEILVVIGIIGVLVGVSVASYSTVQKKSRNAKRRGDLKAAQNCLEQYYSANTYQYPASITLPTIPCGASGSISIQDPLGTGSYVYSVSGVSATGYTISAVLEGESNISVSNLQ